MINNGYINEIENNIYDSTSLGSPKIQFIIFIYLLTLIFAKGEEGDNRYGPNPTNKSALEAIFNLKKKDKVFSDIVKVEKDNSKVTSRNLLIWIGVLSGIIVTSSIVYYFIYLPTVSKNERINCIDNASKISNRVKREQELEICKLKYN